MDRYLWLRLAAILTLLLSAPAAFAQDSTEQRPQTVEQFVKR
jgi:hypothetical protein